MTLAALMRRGALRAVTADAPAPAEVPQLLAGASELPPSDFDRWAWPRSAAMNGAEINRMTGRIAVFKRRGLSAQEADRLADVLVIRDREDDDRRVCLECANLRGRSCGQPEAAGMGRNVEQFALILQRCPAFRVVSTP